MESIVGKTATARNKEKIDNSDKTFHTSIAMRGGRGQSIRHTSSAQKRLGGVSKHCHLEPASRAKASSRKKKTRGGKKREGDDRENSVSLSYKNLTPLRHGSLLNCRLSLEGSFERKKGARIGQGVSAVST